MKNHFDPNRYRMTEQEQQAMWHRIRREAAGGVPQERGRRTSFVPAVSLAAAVATVAVVGAWILGEGRQDAGVGIGQRRVAERRQDPAPAMKVLSLTDETVESSRAMAGGVEACEDVEPEAEIVLAEAAPAARSAPAGRQAAAPEVKPHRPPRLCGRVIDKKTGEPLAYANVLIRGTTRGVAADSLGRFTIERVSPGEQLTLQVMMLGYAPETMTVAVADTGLTEVAFALDDLIVETLAAFDVEGAEYMVETKSAVTEHSVSAQTFEKYAIDSVEEALSKQAGVVMRAGDVGVQGGRRNEARVQAGGLPVPQASPPGSVTGGTKPPNGEQVELMYFDHTGVNPFVAAEDDSLSTFALDVDNASWTVTRNYLRRGMLPPKEAIRVEEFVNAFDAGWPENTAETFAIHTEGGLSRFGRGYHLLRVGLVGLTVADEQRKPANLVFVIDVSGSMDRENRLGLVKRSLGVLLDELREGDRVGIVVYGSQGQILLEPADISDRGRIAAAIDALGPGGSTNVYEGLDLGYAMARRMYDAAKVNRLILCSDGVANNGMSTRAEEILSLVRSSSDEGITISTIGFGMGNYNDVLMEKLADAGDGNYFYVDRPEEGKRVFTENLTGLLQTIAREAKVQVEFSPGQVDRWRLLGYENRDIADRDFRNDAVDAGEVGSAHQVTALYELKLKEAPDADRPVPGPAIPVGTVRLRWEAPAHDTAHAGQVTEIEQPILRQQFAADFAAGSPWMRLQAVVAEFAEILRDSYWARESSLAGLVPVADALKTDFPGDEQVAELAELIRIAADLQEDGSREGREGIEK